MTEREQLEQVIAALEAQRAILGDAVVEAGLGPLRRQLADLTEAEQKPVPVFEGERKLVTVMFADISGFTALSETMDPEAVRELMNRCFDLLVPIIEKYEGMVDKFIGDEIMALFGAPVAHENDPERALRAALEMLDALAAFNADQDTDLGMHVGINTGLVVAGGIGSEGRQQYSVMGDTVNVAARLENASDRGEIFVGPDTHRLAAPLFDFESLEPIRVKGKAEPVAVHRLLAVRAVRGKVRGIQGLQSTMVGRDAELERLQTAIRALQAGQGGVISIIAEAGQGKSRLVAEARQASSAEITWVEGRALSYTQSTSYWIARDVLRALVGVETHTPLEKVSAALRDSVESLLPEQGREDVGPYLAHLLDLPLGEAVAGRIAQLGTQMLQERILQAFSGYVRARSQQPLVLVWEDLHWADGSSLNLLETLLPLTIEIPLLVLLVFRPDKGPIWDFHQRVGETQVGTYQVIELHPLSRDDSARLVQDLLKIENLPDRIHALILHRAEGNPLFLEELLRSLIDAGMVLLQAERAVATEAIHDLKAIDVPDTVQGVIAARIDRLPIHDKYTLQTAAVIGRVFQKRVLEYLLDQEQASMSLDAALGELRRHEFVRLREALASEGISVDQEYIFKHVLTQETAYNSLLMAQRKALHRVAGEAIEMLFPERLDELAATLAYHFERAGKLDKAIAFLLQAGKRAVRLSANEEAIGHLNEGLDLLQALPDSSERIQQELDLLVTLGPVLIAVKGYGAPEVKQTYDRARMLCQQMGETLRLFQVLWGLGRFYLVRTPLQTCREMGEQLLNLAQMQRDPALFLEAYNSLGAGLSYLGELSQAQAHLEKGFALYNPQQHRSHALIYGQDPGMVCLSRMTLTLWGLGYPQQALERKRQALALASELAHPYSMAFALICVTSLHHLRREAQATQEQAEAAIRLCTEQGFDFFGAMGVCLRGWSLFAQGQTPEGIAQLRQGMATWEATGAVLYMPYFLAMLAEMHGETGQTETGLAMLAEALTTVDKSGDCFWEAEIYRLKGELLLKDEGKRPVLSAVEGRSAERSLSPEDCFHTAIDVARRQGGKSLELRAMVSLCRLWQSQGKQEEDRQMLAEIYNWFTEGFDTVDLKEAKALLEELS